MNIAATQYSINTKSFEVYLSGCDRNAPCRKDCCNFELQDFNYGEVLDDGKREQILSTINKATALIDRIFILGGEPLDQNIFELKKFLHFLRTNVFKDIYLFTRFELNQIPLEILKYIDYVKTGWYDKNLETKTNIQQGIILPTNNQKIIKVFNL